MINSPRVLAHLALALLATAVAGCSILRENYSTPTPAPPVAVTAEQAARAMEQDEFFSDYRGETLLVQGTVSSVEQRNGETLIWFSTGIATGLVCDVGTAAPTVKAGDSATAKAQASDAQRSSGSVLLKPCVIR